MEKSEMKVEKVLAWIAALALSAGAFFFSLYTFVKIWYYVIVPLGAPEITKWQAYGVMILMHHYTVPTLYRYQEKPKEGLEGLVKFSLISMTLSAVSWGLAYWIFG
jgi:hypothetical protein